MLSNLEMTSLQSLVMRLQSEGYSTSAIENIIKQERQKLNELLAVDLISYFPAKKVSLDINNVEYGFKTLRVNAVINIERKGGVFDKNSAPQYFEDMLKVSITSCLNDLIEVYTENVNKLKPSSPAASDDTVSGGGSEDTISGGGGDDTTQGGGDDTVPSGSDDTIQGGGGEDTTQGGGSSEDTITGGGGDDTTQGGSGDDTVTGGGSEEDTVQGGGGDDTTQGGEGDDTVQGGGSEGDTVQGGEGDDTTQGGGGEDTPQGGGDDTIQGGD